MTTTSWNRDLTLDEALNDPMIAAVLRADRVEPCHFEDLLRGAAERVASPGAARAARTSGGASPSGPAPHSFKAEDQLQFCRRPAAEGCRAW